MAQSCCSPSSLLFFIGMIGSGLLAIYLADPDRASSFDTLLGPSVPPLPSSCPPPLHDFLQAKIQAHTLNHAKRLEHVFVGTDYQSCVRDVIEKNWDNRPYSIYHLIQHSYLIPADIRLASITRALTSPNPRYILAALISIRHTTPSQLTQAQRTRQQWHYHAMRWATNETQDSLIRQHALQAISAYLSHPNDTLSVVALLTGPTRHDALAWLLSHIPHPITQADITSWWDHAMRLGPETRETMSQLAHQQKQEQQHDHHHHYHQTTTTPRMTAIPTTNYTINLGLDNDAITAKNTAFYTQLPDLMQRISEYDEYVTRGIGAQSRHLMVLRLDIPDYDDDSYEAPVQRIVASMS